MQKTKLAQRKKTGKKIRTQKHTCGWGGGSGDKCLVYCVKPHIYVLSLCKGLSVVVVPVTPGLEVQTAEP